MKSTVAATGVVLGFGLLAVPSLACSSAPADFSGSWQQVVGDDARQDVFRLDLVEVNGHICGSHMSSIDRTSHVSERELGDPPTLAGVVEGSTAAVTIDDSEFISHGTLTLKDGKLKWLRRDSTPVTSDSLATDAVWSSAEMERTADQPEFLKDVTQVCSKAMASVSALGERSQPAAGGPSFDCTKASSPIETEICADPTLANMDLELAKLYEQIRARVVAQRAREQLRDLQRQWLRRRDGLCVAATNRPACLAVQYRQQRVALENWAANQHMAAPGVPGTHPPTRAEAPVGLVAPGTDPICSLLKEPLLDTPNDQPIAESLIPAAEAANQPLWRPVTSVNLPRELSGASESEFDFFNDGTVALVISNGYASHYMAGSTLMIQRRTPTVAGARVEDPLHDSNTSFLPCQFESSGIPIAECPPFSQSHDEAGLSVFDPAQHASVRFRGRYSTLMITRINGSTYVVVTKTLEVGSREPNFAAMLKPAPDRTYQALCLLHHGRLL